jgi:hypothetical protein
MRTSMCPWCSVVKGARICECCSVSSTYCPLYPIPWRISVSSLFPSPCLLIELYAPSTPTLDSPDDKSFALAHVLSHIPRKHPASSSSSKRFLDDQIALALHDSAGPASAPLGSIEELERVSKEIEGSTHAVSKITPLGSVLWASSSLDSNLGMCCWSIVYFAS